MPQNNNLQTNMVNHNLFLMHLIKHTSIHSKFLKKENSIKYIYIYIYKTIFPFSQTIKKLQGK